MRYVTHFVLLMALAFGLSNMAHAELSTRGLTDSQKARLEAQVAQIKAENTENGTLNKMNDAVNDPEKLTKYAEFGEAIAKSLGSAAKELGVAVDEFMDTGTGTLVMVLVVYHFFGSDVIGLVTCFIMIPLFIVLFNKFRGMLKIEGYKTDDKGKLIPIVKERLTGDETTGYVMICIATFVGILIILGVFLP